MQMYKCDQIVFTNIAQFGFFFCGRSERIVNWMCANWTLDKPADHTAFLWFSIQVLLIKNAVISASRARLDSQHVNKWPKYSFDFLENLNTFGRKHNLKDHFECQIRMRRAKQSIHCDCELSFAFALERKLKTRTKERLVFVRIRRWTWHLPFKHVIFHVADNKLPLAELKTMN